MIDIYSSDRTHHLVMDVSMNDTELLDFVGAFGGCTENATYTEYCVLVDYLSRIGLGKGEFF